MVALQTEFFIARRCCTSDSAKEADYDNNIGEFDEDGSEWVKHVDSVPDVAGKR